MGIRSTCAIVRQQDWIASSSWPVRHLLDSITGIVSHRFLPTFTAAVRRKCEGSDLASRHHAYFEGMLQNHQRHRIAHTDDSERRRLHLTRTDTMTSDHTTSSSNSPPEESPQPLTQPERSSLSTPLLPPHLLGSRCPSLPGKHQPRSHCQCLAR